MSVQLIRRRFTVEEYYQMGQAGVLRDDDRVELIEGEIVDTTPIGTRHMAIETRGRGARLQPTAFPDLALAMADLLG